MAATLLLADDSVTIQRVIELTFADEDVRVVVTDDGEAAIQRIDAEPPDIVLADVDLPRFDGYTVAAYVKGSPVLRGIPVLLLTGAFEPIDEEKARASGCEGILVKPFDPQELVGRVRELLAGTPTSPLWPTVPPREAETEATLSPELDKLDEALGQLQGDWDLPGRPFAAMSAPAVEAGGVQAAEASPPSTEPLRPSEARLPAAFVPGAAGVPRISMAGAFAALLAAEQSQRRPARVDRPPITIPESALEDIVRRVLEETTEDAVRRIVLETAERLIKEEIEKIKTNPE